MRRILLGFLLGFAAGGALVRLLAPAGPPPPPAVSMTATAAPAAAAEPPAEPPLSAGPDGGGGAQPGGPGTGRDERLTRLGSRLSAESAPDAFLEVAGLLRMDGSATVSASVLRALVSLADESPAALRTLLDLAGEAPLAPRVLNALRHLDDIVDPRGISMATEVFASGSPAVRAAAVMVLGRGLDACPESGALIVEAARSEALELKVAAIPFLGKAGEAGVDLALDLLRSGDHRMQDRRTLISSVISNDRVLELLASPQCAEIGAEIVEALHDRLDEDHSGAERFGGLVARVLPSYRPMARTPEALRWEYCDLFEIAVWAGDIEFVREVARSAGHPAEMRTGAVAALCWVGGAGGEGLAEARTILSSRAESVALKCGVIDVLAFDAGNPDEPERMAETRALLERASRDDPSEWVRAAAEEALR